MLVPKHTYILYC